MQENRKCYDVTFLPLFLFVLLAHKVVAKISKNRRLNRMDAIVKVKRRATTAERSYLSHCQKFKFLRKFYCFYLIINQIRLSVSIALVGVKGCLFCAFNPIGRYFSRVRVKCYISLSASPFKDS